MTSERTQGKKGCPAGSARLDGSWEPGLRKTSRRFPILFQLLLCIIGLSFAGSDRIRLNQLGFYSLGPKTAIVVSPETWYFSIKSPDLGVTYYSGELSSTSTWSKSKEEVKAADFSSFIRPGIYTMYVAGIGASYPFTISGNAFQEAAKGLVRAFYYQRASTGLVAPNAGKWSRAAGHADTWITIHASAASDPSKPGARSAGSAYPSPKGWYDAGDYGKYVVNAGITTYQLLLLYEQFPGYFDGNGLNIPESNDNLPDLLNEIKWEIDWLLTMQDPADGGVYHKVTSKTFCGDVMPADDRDARYFIGKGSAATFDFAAVCAAACRIYKKLLPSFADSCLSAARYAWEWGMAHPDSAFRNPSDVVTGEYGDTKTGDERQWAASELFIATGDSSFYNAGKDANKNFGVPSWPTVGMLGCYSLALVRADSLSTGRIISTADGLLKRTQTLPYRTSINSEFYWGSNGVAANQGMTMLVAYLLTRDVSYLAGAVHACDYLFGRNAVGSGFVTGFGSSSPMHPHHRPSTADNIAAPVPGLLVGGPNSQSQTDEGCQAELSLEDAKAWLDRSCSYTTNEVAINWNAPAAFLAGGIDAVFTSGAFDLRELRNRYRADTLPPQPLTLSVTGVRADGAHITWKAGEPAAVTIACGLSGSTDAPRRICCARADSGEVSLPGLLPGSVYHLAGYAVDNHGNSAVCLDSFRTEASPLSTGTAYRHDRGVYLPGYDMSISFTHSAAIAPRLIYSPGNSSSRNTIDFHSSGGAFSAVIPASDVTNAGLTYSIIIADAADTLITPVWSIAPDSFSVTTDSFSSPGVYRLVSLPGIFTPQSSLPFFTGSMGDSSRWRFFGYDGIAGSYRSFDTLRPGRGGWLYHKDKTPFTHSARGIAPDTLFPLTLRRGWNCIGNPFPYPIYWDNCMIDHAGALLRIPDSAASRFVRRQFFGYRDTLADRAGNGVYWSNRELTSHAFKDSIAFVPWEAYWVYAERDSVTCLLDASPLSMSSNLPAKQRAAPHSWFCVLTVQCGNRCDGPIALGASELASDGYDAYDSPKPPSITRGFQAGFIRSQWDTPSLLYAADIVDHDHSVDQRWVLKVITASQEPVTLQWKRTGAIDGFLFCSDEKANRVVSTAETESYTFTPGAGEGNREIAFLWSPAPMTGNAALPATWSFSCVPGSSMRFSFTIPPASGPSCPVSITLFDFNGRLVGIPVNGRYAPGSYMVGWSGASRGNTPVAAGTYIARLRGGSFSKSIRLHLVR